MKGRSSRYTRPDRGDRTTVSISAARDLSGATIRRVMRVATATERTITMLMMRMAQPV